MGALSKTRLINIPIAIQYVKIYISALIIEKP